MFKIGDVITGTEDNPYGITNKNHIMIVIGVNPRRKMDLLVVVKGIFTFGQFNVESRFFKHYINYKFKEL